MTGDQGLLDIGEVVARSGLRASALRHYEDVGLIRPAARRGGRRQYRPAVLEVLALVVLCQDVGFTLGEVRDLLGSRAVSPTAWRALVQRKVADLEQQRLQAERAKLLLEHTLGCPHPDILECSHFRSELAHALPAHD
jgi:DNA-binding transcriptional MerR regulator